MALTAQQRVVLGPLLFTSDFDGGNMGSVDRTPLPAPPPIPGRSGAAAWYGRPTDEYGITVSPDCCGTPHENHYRTWFFFGVSLAGPAVLAAAACQEPSPASAPPCASWHGAGKEATDGLGRPLSGVASLVEPRPPRGDEDVQDAEVASASAEGESAEEGLSESEGAARPRRWSRGLGGRGAAGASALASFPDEGLTVRLAVCNMNNQSKLYKLGYRPWYRNVPNEPRWRRLRDSADVGFSFAWGGEPEDGGTGFKISWKHRVDKDGSTAFFAFCAPFGYRDTRDMLHVVEEDFSGPVHQQNPGRTLRYLSESIQEDWVPPFGTGIYFHRQTIERSLDGREVELLTITAAAQDRPASAPSSPEGFGEGVDELPDLPAHSGRAPQIFPGRPIVFASARVHPGEVPAQFVFLGYLRFLLSNDPRAVELRSRFVFKMIPMLNPDGVARGHYRTNSLGLNLNRFYDAPVREEHEGVWAAKRILTHWADQGRLLLYIDFHAHASKRGCFVLANRLMGAAQAWNLSFARLCQLNSPHFDLDGCDFADLAKAQKECGDGHCKEGTSRVAVHRDCRLCHAYTLECNYNTGRFTKPVAAAAGLPAWADSPGSKERTEAPIPYDVSCWAQVGEGICVSVLDLHGHNCCSRVPSSKYGSVARLLGSCPSLRVTCGRIAGQLEPSGSVVPEVPALEMVREREKPCRHPGCCWGGACEPGRKPGHALSFPRRTSGASPRGLPSAGASSVAAPSVATPSALQPLWHAEDPAASLRRTLLPLGVPLFCASSKPDGQLRGTSQPASGNAGSASKTRASSATVSPSTSTRGLCSSVGPNRKTLNGHGTGGGPESRNVCRGTSAGPARGHAPPRAPARCQNRRAVAQ